MTPLASCSILVLLVVFMENAAVFAGRPLTIDDATPVATGQLELELGFFHGRPDGGGRDQRGPVLAVTYGAFQQLEIGLAMQRINRNGPGAGPTHGFEDLHFNAKYKFHEETLTLPALAGALDIKLPTASRAKKLSTGRSDESLLLIATKTLSPFMINANLGYTIVGDRPGARLKNVLRGGTAMEWLFAQQWSIVGEIIGASRTDSAAKNEADFQLGVRFAPLPNLVLDLAAGRSLRPTGNTIHGTFGLTWTIDVGKVLQR